jgi:hypothetical protein
VTCSFASLVEAHFAQSISPDDELRLRAHLPGCSECTRHYERRALLQRVPAVDRLGAALGLPAARRPSRARFAWVLVPVAAALMLTVWLRPVEGDGFTPRGADAGASLAWLEVYRLAAGQSPVPNATRLASVDALAFAYRNPESHPYLMVFAVDAAQHVHWYFPEWTQAETDPAAVSISGGHALTELRAAITQPLSPGPLKLHALFLDSPLTVRSVERAFAAKQPLVKGSEREWVFDLEVSQ